MTDEIISYEQLPLTLKADQVAAVLGISRANAYTLLRREDFPTLRIGKGQHAKTGAVVNDRPGWKALKNHLVGKTDLR